ncbi:MAG TPA: hypothetical protein VHE35_11425 [Kofleriaceae bacterium]|nr:hypothetical protein [Kofleriaceae bacterium]
MMRPLAATITLGAALASTACKFPYPGDVDDAPARDDSGTDALAVPGGDAKAQLSLGTGVRGTVSAVAPPGGGLLIAYDANGLAIVAGTTLPCSSCSVVAKLDASLTELEWYAYADTPEIRESRLAISPSGSVYWGLEAAGDDQYTFTIGGSRFAHPLTISVVGNSDQGQEPGGARIVVALGPTGEARWSHTLRQVDTAPGNALGPFAVFAAADDALVSSLEGKGTLEYVNQSGVTASTAVAQLSQVLHELDPATGHTVSVLVQPESGSYALHQRAIGVPGLDGRGFLRTDTDHDADGLDLGDRLRIGAFQNGFDTSVTDSISVPAGETRFVAVTLDGQPAAFDTIHAAATIAGTHLTAPSTNGDAVFVVLDRASPSVLATMYVAGRGYDRAAFMAGSATDAFIGGTYESTDLLIGNDRLPAPPDAGSHGVFLARVRGEGAALIAEWSRGYIATGSLDVKSAAVDAATGDLYAIVTVSATVDVGLGPIGGTFVARFLRGS